MWNVVDGELCISSESYFSNSAIPMEFILQNEGKALMRNMTDTFQAYWTLNVQ